MKLASARARITMTEKSNGFVLLLLVAFSMLISVHSEEGCAHVVGATATQGSDGTWNIAATVSSTETGWDKYANEWRVEDTDGNILGTRVLGHPHVTEQPFTRSLSGVEIPEDIDVVVIVAQDSVLGYCGDEYRLQIAETEPPSSAPISDIFDSGTFFVNETETPNNSSARDLLHHDEPEFESQHSLPDTAWEEEVADSRAFRGRRSFMWDFVGASLIGFVSFGF